METSNKPTGTTANWPKTGPWKSFLGNLSARPYFGNCKTMAEFDYIVFLNFSESQRFTKDQFEGQWSEAPDYSNGQQP
jgi:hypothetical protein